MPAVTVTFSVVGDVEKTVYEFEKASDYVDIVKGGADITAKGYLQSSGRSSADITTKGGASKTPILDERGGASKPPTEGDER